MASLNGFVSSITGTTGSTNALEPKSGWYVYVMPRGAHASASGTASPIVFDSSDAASRFSVNDWIQVSTATSKIVQVSAVGGNSIAYTGSAVTVTQGDRILRIGTTQPVVTSGNATYQPNTTIYARDDDGATPVSNSRLTTDSLGQYQFWATNNIYDLLVLDSNGSNQAIIADIQIGVISSALNPDVTGTRDIGTSALLWDDFFYDGILYSGITSATGVTGHRLDMVTGLTIGNLWHIANAGAVKVYGDTHGGVFHSYTLPEVVNVKSARFGARGDGSTDDTTAINNAVTYAASSQNGSTGNIVYFPKGTYIINSQIVISNRVRFVGVGKRNSILKAGGSFTFNGTTDSMVRIGDGSTNAFGCTVEHMQIDCNNVSGSIGIYSTRCEEGSGPRDCVIQNWIVKGVFYSGSGCQNWEIYSLELFSGTAATTAIGIDIDTTASSNIIRDVTVNSINATQSTNPAIRIQNAVVNLYRIHVEYYDIGVNFGTGANGLIDGLVGHSTVVRLLQLDSGAMARDISQNSSTYAIWDTVRGYSGSMNGSSWYDLSNDGAAGIGKSARTSAAFAPSRENSPTTFGVTLTVDGAFGVTGSAAFNGSFFFNNFSGFSTVATGPTLTLGAGTMFGLSTAGATTISTITATGNTGRLAVFISKNGNAAITWNEAGNLQVNNTPYAMSDNEVAMFVCDGVTWYQMGAPTTT